MRSAYGRTIPREDVSLTHVGPGTPMGEMMRRYWQPLLPEAELGDGLPKKVRILGEDLVAFKDKTGRVGVLDLHCPHRGTSLEFGRIEREGLRCCYHGWLMRADGKVVEMPCEKPGYAERMDVWQPAYPVHRFGGMVFVYMGPPDKMPLFPMYDIIDTRYRDDIELRAMRLWDDHSIGFVRDCNWLQAYDNVVDAFHLIQLHAANSGDQFGSVVTSAGRPDIGFEKTTIGVRYRMFRDLPNGNRLQRYAEVIPVNAYLVPSIHEQGTEAKERAKASELSWVVPVDDTQVRGLSLVCWPLENGRPVAGWKPGTDTITSIRPGNLRERPYEDKQRRPDDMEAQESQRSIAVHALENLALSDTGVVLMRKMLKDGLKAIEQGEDPPNIVRDPAQNHRIETHAWNTVIAPARDAAE
ncbi:MAG: Rieske 2Fe-2S domain-containing protein [Alphaproteobacteria bacterium]|nr:Rieske 2Fe-2S domain-containing protein [Alphaproteobacteria bacterium]